MANTQTELIIHVPDWCRIGRYVECKMYNNTSGKFEWYKERIIGYSEDGFFHQAHNCPVYQSRFSDYGKTVRSLPEIHV